MITDRIGLHSVLLPVWIVAIILSSASLFRYSVFVVVLLVSGGVYATPFYFMNGVFLKDDTPLWPTSKWKQVIDSLLKKKPWKSKTKKEERYVWNYWRDHSWFSAFLSSLPHPESLSVWSRPLPHRLTSTPFLCILQVMSPNHSSEHSLANQDDSSYVLCCFTRIRWVNALYCCWLCCSFTHFNHSHFLFLFLFVQLLSL